MIRTMWTGGAVALYDFFRGMPLILAKHYKTDTFYKKHGRFINDPADKPSAQELAEIINEAEARARAEGSFGDTHLKLLGKPSRRASLN